MASSRSPQFCASLLIIATVCINIASFSTVPDHLVYDGTLELTKQENGPDVIAILATTEDTPIYSTNAYVIDPELGSASTISPRSDKPKSLLRYPPSFRPPTWHPPTRRLPARHPPIRRVPTLHPPFRRILDPTRDPARQREINERPEIISYPQPPSPWKTITTTAYICSTPCYYPPGYAPKRPADTPKPTPSFPRGGQIIDLGGHYPIVLPQSMPRPSYPREEPVIRLVPSVSIPPGFSQLGPVGERGPYEPIPNPPPGFSQRGPVGERGPYEAIPNPPLYDPRSGTYIDRANPFSGHQPRYEPNEASREPFRYPPRCGVQDDDRVPEEARIGIAGAEGHEGLRPVLSPEVSAQNPTPREEVVHSPVMVSLQDPAGPIHGEEPKGKTAGGPLSKVFGLGNHHNSNLAKKASQDPGEIAVDLEAAGDGTSAPEISTSGDQNFEENLIPTEATTIEPKTENAQSNYEDPLTTTAPQPEYSVSDEVLENFTEELFAKEKANKYVTLSLLKLNADPNATDSSSNHSDSRLLNVQKEAYEIPTIKALRSLYKNYEYDVDNAESTVPEDRERENELLEVFLKTDIMRMTMQWLADEQFIDPDEYEWKYTLRDIWMRKKMSTSAGFEAAFMAEQDPGPAIVGGQSWVYFDYLESRKGVEYLNMTQFEKITDEISLVNIVFKINGVLKPNTRMLVATSPELEMALYTICFYTRRSEHCPISLGGTRLSIYTNATPYFGKDLLDFGYIEDDA